MANIKSAKKRIKVIAVKSARNKAFKTSMKTAIKAFKVSVGEERANFLKLAVKKLDMAVSKGILHKNTAARKKSKLVREAVAAQ